MLVRLSNRFGIGNGVQVDPTSPNNAEVIADKLCAINIFHGKGSIAEVNFVSPVSCIFPYGYVLRILQYGYDTRQFRVDTNNKIHFIGKVRKL